MAQINYEIRLVLTPEDPLYGNFKAIKESYGVRSNTELARICLKKGMEQLLNEEKITEKSQ